MKEKLLKYYNTYLVVPIPLVILLSFVSFPLVVYSLISQDTNFYFDIICYVLSAYSLTILLIRLPYIIKRTKEVFKGDEVFIIVATRNILYKFGFIRKYLTDIEFRALVALCCGLVINLSYAFFRGYNGIIQRSVWTFAIGVYYSIFGLTRFTLIRRFYKSKKMPNATEERRYELHTYKITGYLALGLNVAMAGMIIQMVAKDQTILDYSPIEVILSSLYTFYITFLSVRNIIKFRKDKNLILAASKNLSFIGAIMSMFTLQTSMLQVFATEDIDVQMMNAITGGVVVGISLLTAAFMIVKSKRDIKIL